MENKLFDNLIKIISSQSSMSLDDGEVLPESKSMTFITLKGVKMEEVPKLVEDLQCLVRMLNKAIVKFYRMGVGS